jgi:hypothetical protein
MVMFRRRPGAPAPDPDVFASPGPGRAVSDAEQIVRDARMVQLAEQHGRMDAALKAAGGQYDGAYRRLTAAHRGGDPGKIVSAHTALETALEAWRRAEIVCGHAHQAFLEEMELLGRAAAFSVLAREQEGGGAPVGGGHRDTSPLPARPAPAARAAGGRRRVRGILGRFLAPRVANRACR